MQEKLWGQKTRPWNNQPTTTVPPPNSVGPDIPARTRSCNLTDSISAKGTLKRTRPCNSQQLPLLNSVGPHIPARIRSRTLTDTIPTTGTLLHKRKLTPLPLFVYGATPDILRGVGCYQGYLLFVTSQTSCKGKRWSMTNTSTLYLHL